MQLLAQILGASHVAFDDLHRVVAFQLFRQALADVAAAGDEDALVGVVQPPQLAHDDADVFARGNEEHLVVGLDDGVALGDDGAVLAEDGGHAGVDVGHVLAQGAQLVAHQWAAVVGAHADQLYPAVGEVQHLQRAGVLDEATHMMGNQGLGADQGVDGQGLGAEQLRVFQVLGGAHAGDAVGGVEHGIGHLAGDHVGLVAVGHRDEHVGIFGAGPLQYIGTRAVAGDGADVEAVLEVAQHIGVGIDHGDVVGLAGQVLGQRAADLSGTEYDDLHGWSRDPLGSMSRALSLRYRWVRSMPISRARREMLPPVSRSFFSR